MCIIKRNEFDWCKCPQVHTLTNKPPTLILPHATPLLVFIKPTDPIHNLNLLH